MITKLNLASRPFRNRSLPYVIALSLLAFAVTGAIFSFAKLREINTKSEIADFQIREMEAKLQELKGKGEQVQKALTPEQQDLLVASHKLTTNKSFGWSRLFADLEAVLPGSVSASRISVEKIYRDDDRIKAELGFAVLSLNYQSVITMIDNMNQSGIFKAELRGQSLQKSGHFTYTEYTMHLIYAPRYGYSPVAPQTDVAAAESSNGGTQ